MSDYSLYILHCADDTYYTGIARNVGARLDAHEKGARGAKYLRGRSPFELVFERPVGDRSSALKLEHRIKGLSRKQKLALIDGQLELGEI